MIEDMFVGFFAFICAHIFIYTVVLCIRAVVCALRRPIDDGCYVCMERAPCATNADPCGHGILMCDICFERIKTSSVPRCPLCRVTLIPCVQIVNE